MTEMRREIAILGHRRLVVSFSLARCAERAKQQIEAMHFY